MPESIKALKELSNFKKTFTIENETFYIRCAYPHLEEELFDSDVQFYCEIREQTSQAFFDQRNPTLEEAKSWVKKYYASDFSQINFIICNQDGDRLGFFGFSNLNTSKSKCEFGRVMKSSEAPKSLMTKAIQTGLHLISEVSDIRTFYLEVFEDNVKAILLYKRLGFKKTGKHFRAFDASKDFGEWIKSPSKANSRAVLEMTFSQD